MDRPRDPEADARAARGARPIDSDEESADNAGERDYYDPVAEAMEREMERERQSGSSGTDGDSSSGADDGGSSYTVREGVTRAIDDEDLSTIRNEQNVTEAQPHTRVESMDSPGVDPALNQPPDLPESVDVASVAPDGTAIGGSSLTSPTGEAVGGSGLSDAIQSRAGELGGDALGRGIDFDPLAPGTNESGAGSTGGGDADLDRMLMEHDGSLMSAELKKMDPNWVPPKHPTRAPDDQSTTPKIKGFDDPAPAKPEPTPFTDAYNAVKEFLGLKPDPPNKMENPEGDAVDSATNLERVTAMQGGQVNPSTNPNDGGDEVAVDPVLGAELAGGAEPGTTVLGMPEQDEDVKPTTLTQAGSLGSSPVTNPTDPAIGDDGIIHGGSYTGGSTSGSGGGEVMPRSSTAAASPLGGEGDANLPITLEPAPVGGASALGGEGDANLPITLEPAPVPADALSGKHDVNGVTVDMVTGQVIGSVAPATGGELGAAGGAVSQGDEGDDDGGGVQSMAGAPAAAAALGVAPLAAELAVAPPAAEAASAISAVDAGSALSAGDASAAFGDPAAALGGSAISSGVPDEFEPPPDPPPGDDGPTGPPDGDGGDS